MELNEQQKAAAAYAGKAQCLLVTAGAGCGKTRTIIARAIHLVKTGTPPSKILMMTFTNRAAREMKVRMKRDIGPLSDEITAGTFHAFCYRALLKLPNSFDITGQSIIDADDQEALMRRVMKSITGKLTKEQASAMASPGELTSLYSYSRNTCQAPETYMSSFTDIAPEHIELYSRFFAEYENQKKKRGYLDFDDLLVLFDSALARKPKLRQAITHLYDEVLVDEIQDTNPIQFRILQHFSSEGRKLFCVGDPAQSIYGFRGAEFKHVYSFTENFPNAAVLHLTLNYRSHQEILDLSNWLLKRSPLDYGKPLSAERGCGSFKPGLHDFYSTQAEASWVADTIIERRESGSKYGDMMVLVRSSFDARPFEAEFLQRQIPYRYIGGTKITQVAHVKDVFSLLRITRNSRDELAWTRFLTLWPRVGQKTAEGVLSRIIDEAGEDPLKVLTERFDYGHPAVVAYRNTLNAGSHPKPCVSAAVRELSPLLKDRYHDKWEQRSQDLDLLVSVSERYGTLAELIDDFTLEPMTGTEIKKLEEEDVVTLITVHSAKGTEARICFVVNARPGIYPHSRSFGDLDSEEEERRVLYVACTRAQDELHITRSTDRRAGFYIENSPTAGEEYFLAQVPGEHVERQLHNWQKTPVEGLESLKDEF
jgi:DNA helicase-2/ATP-dependent DNA helicase PcrA